MSVGTQGYFAYPLKYLAKRGITRQVGTQDQRIDKEADHVCQFGARAISHQQNLEGCQ